MAWAKNGTPDTLGSSGDTMQITNLTAKKFNQFLIHSVQVTAGITHDLTFNNNTNTVYAERFSNDGAADSTGVSQTEATLIGDASDDRLTVVYCVSISGEEKLIICHTSRRLTVGAANAPSRNEFVGKFVPSPDADITRIDIDNSGAGSYDTNSNLSALGTD
jgi:hypothetical protein